MCDVSVASIGCGANLRTRSLQRGTNSSIVWGRPVPTFLSHAREATGSTYPLRVGCRIPFTFCESAYPSPLAA